MGAKRCSTRQFDSRAIRGGWDKLLQPTPVQLTEDVARALLVRMQIHELSRPPGWFDKEHPILDFAALHSSLDPSGVRYAIGVLQRFWDGDTWDQEWTPECVLTLLFPGNPLLGFLRNLCDIREAIYDGMLRVSGDEFNALERKVSLEKFVRFLERAKLKPQPCCAPSCASGAALRTRELQSREPWEHSTTLWDKAKAGAEQYRPISAGGTYDEGRRNTWPDIAAWLIAQGFKKTTARHVATVLKPDKPRLGGRPPKERGDVPLTFA